MFYSLTGNVIFTDEQALVISCSGVGFQCVASRNTIALVNANNSSEVTLFTYLNVREDALDLFGFYTKEELEAFKMLIGVSGVGPKMALSVLSQLRPDDLALAIASGDAKAISAANGVGAKLAQRVIMELKDKMSSVAFVSDTVSSVAQTASAATKLSTTSEAVSALVALGYSRSEASVAVGKLDASLSVEELIKQALKNMTLRF